MNTLYPRQTTPELAVQTLQGDAWALTAQQPEQFTMVVFYRGYHCPICKTYLQELNRLADNFAEKGVTVLAISSDTEERARLAQEEWALGNLTVAHSLSAAQAREWGLYRSAGRGKTSIGIEEPDTFSEPGLFLIRPDQSLYWGQVSTMPFARPHFREILGAIDFVVANGYPARGELLTDD